MGEWHGAETTVRGVPHSSAMSALPLAHVGHWYLWIPYVIPVAVVLAASLHAFRQQRRENREGEHLEKPRP